MKTIKSILILSILIASGTLFSQSEGTIKGTVLDEKMQPMLFVPVAIMQDSTILNSTQTDENGEFAFKNVVPGKYKVRVQNTGYAIQERSNINVNPNQIRYLTFNMTIASTTFDAVVISESFIEPPFDSQVSTLTSITLDQIERSAVGKNDLTQIITILTPAAIPTNDGRGMYVRGAREGSTAYYVDGARTMNIPDVPGMGIGGINVITGGIPAQFGDCTGGVVVITTKDYKWEMNRKKNAMEEFEEREMTKKKKNISE